MYFSTVVLASAALCGVTICATPLPSTNESYNVDLGSVLKRQSADCICGDVNAYSSSQQARVFQGAQSYDLTGGGGVVGRNGAEYPHEFRNTENLSFPDCAGVPAPYREFPILASGRIFGAVGNDDPLTDRIVYKITSHSPVTGLLDNFAFCGVMTNLGAPQNQSQCTRSRSPDYSTPASSSQSVTH